MMKMVTFSPNKHQIHVLVSIILVSSSVIAAAEEGMWTYDNFPSDTVAKTYGLAIDQAWLDHARQSTVRLDGGCTGSFVSDSGLVLTNNHCVWGCIRNLSTDESNLSEQGFLARSREDELVCPGVQISVLQEIEDVTESVAKATRGLGTGEANAQRDRVLSELADTCENQSDLECETVTLYQGGRYQLYKYERYDDVRLVFAPEFAIAAFGGDPDNFEYPRYCLDMSMLRVYDDQGQPARTPHFLEWRVAGPDPDEPVFVSGHPGSTERLLTAAELLSLRQGSLPLDIQLLSEMRGRMAVWATTSPTAERIVAQRLPSLENGLKVQRNRLGALQDERMLAVVKEREAEERRAVLAHSKLGKDYEQAWREVERAIEHYETFATRHRMIAGRRGFRSAMLGNAITLVEAAHELRHDSDERPPRFRDAALPSIERRLGAPIPVNRDFEELMLGFSLEKLREWLGPDDPLVRHLMSTESPQQLATRVTTESKLDDPEFRTSLWRGGPDAIDASEDPMIELARSIVPDIRSLGDRFEEQVEAPIRAAHERIARARFELYGETRYPDATFTLRLSYGTVSGWLESGAQVPPFTTLAALRPRVTGQDPFRLPDSWLERSERIDEATRFNLVSSNDIIGGNSGSPLIDGDGQLVGLVFDGNRHSIAGRYWFDDEINRTVSVHPEIMIESMREIYGATELLEELSLAEPKP